MPRVNIEGVGLVDFPDDMSHEEIEAAIHRDILPYYPQAAEDSKESALLGQESPESVGAEPAPEDRPIEDTENPEPGGDELVSLTDSTEALPEPGKEGLLPLDDPKPAGDWMAAASPLERHDPLIDPAGEKARLGLAENSPAGVFDANLLLRVWANVGEPAHSMVVASSTGDAAKPSAVEQDYLEQRLQNQIDWYDRKSQSSQFWYKKLRIVELVAAALIPLLSGYSEVSVYMTPLVGLLGLLITVVAGILNLNQYQERWVAYRSTSESLQQEKFLYLARCAPYDGEDAFTRLVRRVEGLIGKEYNAWIQNTAKSVSTKPQNEG
ncbi:MAG: DUF4231 domain-containing protein [Methylococcaceae bacterium]|nr:DUF4231 domain-containing protein [Methylococcaceae bacterium]